MNFLKWCFTLGFAFAGLYHLFLAFIPKVGDASTGGRHLLFFLINIGATVLVAWNRPKALLLLIPLIIQQLYSHGLFLWQEWDGYQRIDWPSVIVLVGMPVLAGYIFYSNRKNSVNP